MSCMFLFNFVNYIFLLVCVFRSVYSISLYCSLYCLCVNLYCTAATGCQPNCCKQNISYDIITVEVGIKGRLRPLRTGLLASCKVKCLKE